MITNLHRRRNSWWQFLIQCCLVQKSRIKTNQNNLMLISHEQMIYFKSQLKGAMSELYNIIFSLYFMDLFPKAVRIYYSGW